MARSRVPALLLVVILSAYGLLVSSARAEQDDKQELVRQNLQKRLDERLVESKPFRIRMPLAEFLVALEKQLPAEKKVALRIDREAFGDKLADVLALPIVLPARPEKTTLRRVLEIAMKISNFSLDYRLDATGVVLTTPQRALYTTTYDIRDIVAKPVSRGTRLFSRNTVLEAEPIHGDQPADRAARIIQALDSALDEGAPKQGSARREAILVLNGVRLVIQANAAQHAQITELLQAFRRQGDVAVVMNSRLYEVDDKFYSRLKKAGHFHSLKELEIVEREYGTPSELLGMASVVGHTWGSSHLWQPGWIARTALQRQVEEESLFQLLKKQQPIMAGEGIKVDNGLAANVLSRHKVVHCLADPNAVRQGDKTRQTILDGVSFRATVRVSSDRRIVQLTLTEKTADLQTIDRVKLIGDGAKEVEAETPIVKESTHTEVNNIPDGGSLLMPVHYRPRSLAAKNRWWVLRIDSRIYIEEEERVYRSGGVESILPALVADILKNPRLKTTREFYGSPDDNRFALVNSDTWTMPDDFKLDIPGMQLTPAGQKGKRLLGIRIDQYHEGEKENDNTVIVVTLINAGGSANGAVIGGGSIRYHVKQGEKGSVVALAEPRDP